MDDFRREIVKYVGWDAIEERDYPKKVAGLSVGEQQIKDTEYTLSRLHMADDGVWNLKIDRRAPAHGTGAEAAQIVNKDFTTSKDYNNE